MKPADSAENLFIKFYKSLLDKVENNWKGYHPKSFEKYVLAKNGISSSIKDFNTFIRLRVKFSGGSNLNTFSRHELTVYRKYPPLMIKTVPVLMLSIAPGASIILPLLFVKPTTFLTPYFWTEAEIKEASETKMNSRFKNMDKVNWDMLKFATQLNKNNKLSSDALQTINHNSEKLDFEAARYLYLLENLFQKHFNIYDLPISYLRHLKLCHEISWNPTISTRNKLSRHSTLIGYEDHHLVKEDFKSLPVTELYEICITRGLNPYQLSNELLYIFLKLWVTNSTKVDINNHSFRLHLIIFISRQFQRIGSS